MGTRTVSAVGEGRKVKVRYLGDAQELQTFVGAATREEYSFGGRVNLGEVDTRDLATGQSYAPGLFELRGPGGARLFELHVPRERKKKPEPPEKPDAEDPVPSDQD